MRSGSRAKRSGWASTSMASLTRSHAAPRGRLRDDPLYGVPYERLARRSPGRVLVVGAGTGNDVAVALAMGAERGGCGRDRPGNPRPRSAPTPGQALPRSSGDHTRRRWTGLPRGGPMPASTSSSSRFPTRWCSSRVAATYPPRELPVHPRGNGDGTRASDRARRLRYVQPRSRELARRSVRGNGGVRVRA